MEQKILQSNGAGYIREQIRNAVEKGERSATITGNWEMNDAVRIPSDFTLILDGCYLRLADGSFTNMFVNEHHDTDLGRTPAGTDRNIAILGKNGAVLDGGLYNGLSERSQLKNGLPAVWKNNLILFTNVDGFEMSGFACHNQRWWALNFIFCCNGKLHDLSFKGNDIGIDENGNEYHGLLRSKPLEPLVRNADGIDLRVGCHDVTIENITGFTEDDTIALTGLHGMLEKAFMVEDLPWDICNVTIKNVTAAAYYANVRLLNQGAVKLHDILIDGVTDTSAECPHLDVGYYGVRIGDECMYGTRHATADETYNITVKNIRSRARCGAVGLAGEIGNLVLENIEPFDGTVAVHDLR